MKKLTLLLTIVLCLGNFASNAQSPKEKHHQKIKALKINLISEKLNMTDEEAEKFWPVYFQYEKKYHLLKKGKLKALKKRMKKEDIVSKLSDKEAKEYLNSLLKINEELAKNQRQFYKRLEKVLDSKKILKLYITEMEFNSKMLKRLRRHHHRKKE